jgi:hypothetical protein
VGKLDETSATTANGHHACNMPEFKCGISNGRAHGKKKGLRDVFVNWALQVSVNSIGDMAGEAKSAVKAKRCSGCTCDPILTSKTWQAIAIDMQFK